MGLSPRAAILLFLPCPHPILDPKHSGLSLPSEQACFAHPVLVDRAQQLLCGSVFTWLSWHIWAAAEAQSLVKMKVTGTHGHGEGQSQIPQ